MFRKKSRTGLPPVSAAEGPNSALGLGGGVVSSPGFGAGAAFPVPAPVGAVTGVALGWGLAGSPIGCCDCATTGGAADGEDVGDVGCELGDVGEAAGVVGDVAGVTDCEGRVEGECAGSIGRTSGPPPGGAEP